MPVVFTRVTLQGTHIVFWLDSMEWVSNNSMILSLRHMACNLWAGNKHRDPISTQCKLIYLFVRLKYITCRSCNNVGINRSVDDFGWPTKYRIFDRLLLLWFVVIFNLWRNVEVVLQNKPRISEALSIKLKPIFSLFDIYIINTVIKR
jgi:hypothetical protein